MCARCFPTTTEVVVTSSLTRPRTLISTGLSVSNSKYTGVRVPNRVPVDRLAGAVREAVNPATMRASEWRDPDSNRGHHDFQSCGAAAESGVFAGGFVGLRASGGVHVFPHFAVVCRVKRPTRGSVGLFVAPGQPRPDASGSSANAEVPTVLTVGAAHAIGCQPIYTDGFARLTGPRSRWRAPHACRPAYMHERREARCTPTCSQPE